MFKLVASYSHICKLLIWLLERVLGKAIGYIRRMDTTYYTDNSIMQITMVVETAGIDFI